MALKATIFKVELEIADIDRDYFQTHTLTLARHASETDERMMVRVVAFACHAHESLAFTEGLGNPDEPDLWQRDLTGAIDLWIDLGHPDERRILKACGRARQVVIFCYANNSPAWWERISPRLERARNLTVVHVPSANSLGALAERTMRIHGMIQDGQLWFTSGETTVHLDLVELRGSSVIS